VGLDDRSEEEAFMVAQELVKGFDLVRGMLGAWSLEVAVAATLAEHSADGAIWCTQNGDGHLTRDEVVQSFQKMHMQPELIALIMTAVGRDVFGGADPAVQFVIPSYGIRRPVCV
jgi:hypothetical protein